MVPLSLGFLILLGSSFSLAHADDEIPDEPAKIELIADVTSFLPGSTFRLGVKFTMVEHWHIYWHSAREGGVGTTLKWKLPPGWTAGPIEWPVPRRYVLPGPLTAYGYDQEVLLQSEITVPADAVDSSVTLAVDANWLVCKEICLIGEGSPQLKLPRASDSIQASKEAPLFHEWRARVPSSSGQLPISVRERLSEGEKRATWTIAVEWPDSIDPPPAGTIEAYPFDFPGGALDEGKITTEGRRSVFTFVLEVYEEEFRPESLGTLIVWPAADRKVKKRVPTQLPVLEVKGAPAVHAFRVVHRVPEKRPDSAKSRIPENSSP